MSNASICVILKSDLTVFDNKMAISLPTSLSLLILNDKQLERGENKFSTLRRKNNLILIFKLKKGKEGKGFAQILAFYSLKTNSIMWKINQQGETTDFKGGESNLFVQNFNHRHRLEGLRINLTQRMRNETLWTLNPHRERGSGSCWDPDGGGHPPQPDRTA